MRPPTGRVRAVFVDSPTVRVEQIDLEDGSRIVLKRYSFPRFSQRLKGALRHTLLGTPKALRESRALERLQNEGIPVLAALAVGVHRGWDGFVRESWLTTPFRPQARNLGTMLRGGDPLPPTFWEGVGTSVGALHSLGCWYRGLVPRNLLVEPDFSFHLIDAAKCRWKTPPLPSPLVRLDLARLFLPAQGAGLLPEGAWPAFLTGYRGLDTDLSLEEILRPFLPAARRRAEAVIARERTRLLAE